MDFISIMLGVVFPILVSTGLALALAPVSHTAYWIAKGAFALAGLDLAGLLVWWLYNGEGAAWKTVVGAAFGLAIVAFLPEVLRWVDANETAVVAERTRRIDVQVSDLRPIIEALQQNQEALAQSEYTRRLAATALESFDNLRRSIEAQEQVTGKKDIEDRLNVAEHIVGELKDILANVRTFPLPQGQAIIIKTGPNTFRVTFPVPMRIPPNLNFTHYPKASTPNVTDKTKVGFVVTFTPLNIPVEMFGFEASAEL